MCTVAFLPLSLKFAKKMHILRRKLFNYGQSVAQLIPSTLLLEKLILLKQNK
jgi:hypothetical protein